MAALIIFKEGWFAGLVVTQRITAPGPWHSTQHNDVAVCNAE
jgi:hypothetical protein